MSYKDYIPKNDAKLLEWSSQLFDYATANAKDWKVPAPDGEMSDKMDVFKRCLEKTSLPNRGKIDTLEKNEARKSLVKDLRTYVQGFLARNPYVTNVDREKMGITIYDVIPTPVPPPKGQAEADILYPGKTQLQLNIKHVDGTPHDPKADYGFRVFYGAYSQSDVPPTMGKELPRSKFTRQKKALFGFKQNDSGKTAHFCIRYENSKGETGPWGPMFSAVIP